MTTYKTKTLDQWKHDLLVANFHRFEAEDAIAQLEAQLANATPVELPRSVVEDLLKIVGAMSENDADALLKRDGYDRGSLVLHDQRLLDTYKALEAALKETP